MNLNTCNWKISASHRTSLSFKVLPLLPLVDNTKLQYVHNVENVTLKYRYYLFFWCFLKNYLQKDTGQQTTHLKQYSSTYTPTNIPLETVKGGTTSSSEQLFLYINILTISFTVKHSIEYSKQIQVTVSIIYFTNRGQCLHNDKKWSVSNTCNTENKLYMKTNEASKSSKQIQTKPSKLQTITSYIQF